MRLNEKFAAVCRVGKIAGPIIAIGVSLAACGTNRIGEDSMRTTGTTLGPLGGLTERKFDEGAARATVIAAGMNNENQIVSDTARNRGCLAPGETGERLKRRDRLAVATGGQPQCR